MNCEYKLFKEKSDYYYDFILNHLSKKESVIVATDELYRLVQEIEIDNETAWDIVEYYTLLYIVFELLNNTENKNICEKKLVEIFKTANESTSPIDLKFKLEEVVRKQTPFYDNLDLLYDYCFKPIEKFNTNLDKDICRAVEIYFREYHLPSCRANLNKSDKVKSFFYADREYIVEQLAIEFFHEEKDKEKEKENKEGTPNPTPWRLRSISIEEYKIIRENFYPMAEKFLDRIQISYTLRHLYPKTDLIEKDKFHYEAEYQLFEKALFNKKTFTDEKYHLYIPTFQIIKKIYYNIIEEQSINEEPFLINQGQYHIIEEQPINEEPFLINQGQYHTKDIKKSVWLGLYLLSKEIKLEEFQDLLKVKTDNSKGYTCNMLNNLSKTLIDYESKKLLDNTILEAFCKNRDNALLQDKSIPQKLTYGQKSLIKGLLFCCMWEKVNLKEKSHKLNESILKNRNNTSEKNERIYNDINTSSGINALFSKTQISEIANVLSKASEFLQMKENGFDYSFLNLENEIYNPEDIAILLYNFSRIESDSTPFLINTLNLLRERQKRKFPLSINDKSKDLNAIKKQQNQLKQIDIGFDLPFYANTLEPLNRLNILEPFSSKFRNSDNEDIIDNRYLYQHKRVKFICETDKVFIKNQQEEDRDFKENILESAEIAFHSIYRDNPQDCVNLLIGVNKKNQLGDFLCQDTN